LIRVNDSGVPNAREDLLVFRSKPVACPPKEFELGGAEILSPDLSKTDPILVKGSLSSNLRSVVCIYTFFPNLPTGGQSG
jgi:hypothetical protein